MTRRDGWALGAALLAALILGSAAAGVTATAGGGALRGGRPVAGQVGTLEPPRAPGGQAAPAAAASDSSSAGAPVGGSTSAAAGPAARASSFAQARPPGAAGTSACLAAAGLSPDSLVRLTFLTTNDLHGALESRVYPWSDGREVGGAAALAAYIEEARAPNPDGTVLLDAGDIMQGTPISNLVQGESVIDFFNAVGYDAAAMGNHEFDWGLKTLEARMAQARFPLLSANIVRKADGVRPRWSTPTALVRRKGLTIGIVGLTTRTTPQTTLPEHIADLDFTDLAAAVNETVPRLKAAGADLVVVVAHAGGYFNPDSNLFGGEIAEAMRGMSPEVDLVVSGHTHTLLNGEVNGIPLVQARSSGTALGIVDLWVDPRTRDVVCSDAEVVTTYADAVHADPAIAALVQRYRDRIGSLVERVVAEAAHPLTTSRRRESVLGDLIADAQRAATGAEVALMNSGGIRAEIDAGPISWREAFEVQPFVNTLFRLELDGRALKAALENGVSGDHGLVQVSGVRFEVDTLAPRGSRVRALTLEDGTPVARDSAYTVVANNFMAQGGDGYTMLRDVPQVENTGIVDLECFVAHLARLPQPIRYGLPGRIRFVGAAAPRAAGKPARSRWRGQAPRVPAAGGTGADGRRHVPEAARGL